MSALFPNTSPLHLVVVAIVLGIVVLVGAFLVSLALSGKISAEEEASDLEKVMAERARHSWVKIHGPHSVCTCGATGTWVKTVHPAEYPDGTALARTTFVITAPPHIVDPAAARFHAVRQYV